MRRIGCLGSSVRFLGIRAILTHLFKGFLYVQSSGTPRFVRSMSSTIGAVVTEHRLATEIGTAILARGGNAIDAIIAAVIAVNTICPHDSDIGGSGFAIIREADGSHHAIDFRDTAPVGQAMYCSVNTDPPDRHFPTVAGEKVDEMGRSSDRRSR